MLARQILIELARKVEEEKEWTVEPEDKIDFDDLLNNVEEYERASREGKQDEVRLPTWLKYKHLRPGRI